MQRVMALGETNAEPMLKMNTRPIFCARETWSLKTVGSGSIKTMRSVIMPMMQVAM